MVAHWVGGAQMTSMGHTRWDFGKMSGGAVKSFLVILDLRWVIALKLDSSMRSSVGIKPSMSLFLTY
jgi:hypothetical protein